MPSASTSPYNNQMLSGGSRENDRGPLKLFHTLPKSKGGPQLNRSRLLCFIAFLCLDFSTMVSASGQQDDAIVRARILCTRHSLIASLGWQV